MNYGYGNYSEGGYGAEGGNMGAYGRRGVPGTGRGRGRSRRYRGPEEKMEEMMEHFGNYSEASEAANMGNYGAEEDSVRSLDKMMKCVCMFVDMLEEGAGSQEEAQIIRKYKKKMAE